MKKLRLTLIFLLILGLVLPNYSTLQAISKEEEEVASGEGSIIEDVSIGGIPENKPQKAEYVPGQLIVKLKEGKTLDDIADLNQKYGVTSSEKVFKDTPHPERPLKQLKDKLVKLDTEHEHWYWQLDKNSQEYKEYIAKIEKEKEGLQKQIQTQEELIVHLEQRQERAPEGATAPNLENIYLLKTDQKPNIPQMAEEYKANPSVEYAEPNYKATIQIVPNG